MLVGFIAGAIVGVRFGRGRLDHLFRPDRQGPPEVYAEARTNIESGDLDQFGQEVQANVAQAQAQVEANVAQVQSNVADVQAQVQDKVAQVRGTSGGNGTTSDEATTKATTK